MPISARDVMSSDVTTVSVDQTVADLIQLLRESHFSAVPVVDGEGRAVGLISETDVLRALAYTLRPPGSGEFRVKLGSGPRRASAWLLEEGDAGHTASALGGLLARTMQEMMTPVLHTCSPDTSLAEVCERMVWKEVHRIVVTDEAGKVVGLISSLDVVRRFGEDLRERAGEQAE